MSATCQKQKWEWNGLRNICSKPAKMEFEGRAYCGVHDPVRIQARAKERAALETAAYELKVAARDRAKAIAAARDAVVEAAKAYRSGGERHDSDLCDAVDALLRLEAQW